MARFSRKMLGDAMRGVTGLAPLGKKVKRRPRILSTGIDSFDVLTGIGGFPEGRFVIKHGSAGSGKTTCSLQFLAAVQAAGGVGIYLDWEHKLSLEYAEALGVNIEDLIYDAEIEIMSIERGFGSLEAALLALRALDADAPIAVVWDSLQSVAAERAYGKEWGEGDFNGEAAAYSRAFKRFGPVLAKTRAVLIGISQVRSDMAKFARPGAETIGVGKACLHAANMVYEWKKPKVLKGAGTEREGDIVEVVCIKNQSTGLVGDSVKMHVVTGCGVDPLHSLYEAAVHVGRATLRGGGGWFEVTLPDGEVKRVHSMSGFQKWLAEDPVVFETWRQAVLADGSGLSSSSAPESS